MGWRLCTVVHMATAPSTGGRVPFDRHLDRKQGKGVLMRGSEACGE